MRRLGFSLLLLSALAIHSQDEVRFSAIDVWVDAGDEKLAVYQIEITVPGQKVAMIVGVEGGDPKGVFGKAPYYDPKALQGGRIVLGAFTLKDAPKGLVRVARLHMQETGAKSPRYEIKVVAAAKPDGTKISLKAKLKPAGDKR